MITKSEIQQLRDAYKKGTQGEWKYRSKEFDDWGLIRGGEDEFPVAKSLGPFTTTTEQAEHRRNGTDPYFDNANLIVLSHNLLPTLLDSYEEMERNSKQMVCSYCGKVDPKPEPYTPMGMAEFLAKEHLPKCPTHPINAWFAERDRAEKAEQELSTLRAQMEKMKGALLTVRDGFDHDADAHKYGTACRMCLAEAALSEAEAK